MDNIRDFANWEPVYFSTIYFIHLVVVFSVVCVVHLVSMQVNGKVTNIALLMLVM